MHLTLEKSGISPSNRERERERERERGREGETGRDSPLGTDGHLDGIERKEKKTRRVAGAQQGATSAACFVPFFRAKARI